MTNTTVQQSPVDGSTKVNLGDREVSLVLDGEVAERFDEEFQVDLFGGLDAVAELKPRQFNYLIWLCTQNEGNGDTTDKWPTLPWVKRHINGDNLHFLQRTLVLMMTPPEVREVRKNAITRVQTALVKEAIRKVDAIEQGADKSLPSFGSSVESPAPSSGA